MNQVWERVQKGQHTALVGVSPGEPPASLDLRLIRVSCDVPPTTLGPLLDARRKVGAVLDLSLPLLDQARQRVVLGLRRRILGDMPARAEESALVELCNRLAQQAPRPYALLFDAADEADEATLDVLKHILSRPGWLKLPVLLAFRKAPSGGAASALLEALREAQGPEAIARDGEGDPASAASGPAVFAELIRALPPEVIRVLRVGAVMGSGFEADLVAALLGADPLLVVEAIQRAVDAGAPVDDRGEGRFHLPEPFLRALRVSTLPSMALLLHRRLAALLMGALPGAGELRAAHVPETKRAGVSPFAAAAREAPAIPASREAPPVVASGKDVSPFAVRSAALSALEGAPTEEPLIAALKESPPIIVSPEASPFDATLPDLSPFTGAPAEALGGGAPPGGAAGRSPASASAPGDAEPAPGVAEEAALLGDIAPVEPALGGLEPALGELGGIGALGDAPGGAGEPAFGDLDTLDGAQDPAPPAAGDADADEEERAAESGPRARSWPYAEIFAEAEARSSAGHVDTPMTPPPHAERNPRPVTEQSPRGVGLGGRDDEAQAPPWARPSGAVFQGDDARAAAHLTAAGDTEAAVERYLAATQQAAVMGATAQALAHGRKALRLLDNLPASRKRRLLRVAVFLEFGRIQWQAAGPGSSFTLAGALEVLDRAQASLEDSDPLELITAVASLIAGVCYDIGDLRSLERALDELSAVSRRLLASGDAASAARLLNDQAAVYIRMGDPVRATHLLGESRKIYEAKAGEDPVAMIEMAETDHLFARIPLHVKARPGREGDALSMGLDHAIAAERTYRRLGDNREIGRVWETMGRLELRKGRLERATKHLSAATELQGHIGDLIGLARSTAALSEVLAARGLYKEAVALLGESVAFNLEKGSPIGLAFNRRAFDALARDAEVAGDAGSVLVDVGERLIAAEQMLGRLSLPGEASVG